MPMKNISLNIQLMIKKISSKRVIEAVMRDFGIVNQDWIYDANEWIGNGVLMIGCNNNYRPNKATKLITNYKIKLPCDIEVFQHVFLGKEKIEFLHNNNQAISDKKGVWYYVVGDYLHFSFTGKEVNIYYLDIAIDEEGFICILDNVFLIEALKWKVLMHLLMRGQPHPVISLKDATAMWDKTKDIAANNIVMPTPDEYEDIMRAYIDMIPNLKYN